MKKRNLLLVAALCLTLAGCKGPAAPRESAPAGTPTGAPAAGTPAPAVSPDAPTPTPAPADTPDPAEQTATLYIGTKSAGFAEYSMTYQGELTPERLIQGIGDLTGWDLTLAEPVVSGKGGMSVCLAAGSALFTGPPDPQKDEFHMYDGTQLAETILDSIQKTLQMGFTGAGGDPDALDIWYYMEGEQPLELPALGLSWALDQPYQWSSASGR